MAITLTNVSMLPLQVRVRKHGDAKKYNAHVIHVGHECDIAMVTICCVNLYICVSSGLLFRVITCNTKNFTMMLWMKFSVVERIHSKSNKLASGVESTATGDARLRTLVFMLGQICKIEQCWAKLSVIFL